MPLPRLSFLQKRGRAAAGDNEEGAASPAGSPPPAARQTWANQAKRTRGAVHVPLPRSREDAAVLAALHSPLQEAAACPRAIPKEVIARIEAVVAPALQPSQLSERISARQQAPSSPAHHGNMQPPANQQLAAAVRPAITGAAMYAALPFPPGSLPMPVLLQLAQQQQPFLARQRLAAVHAESRLGMMQALLAPQQVQQVHGAGTAPAPGPPAPTG